MPLIHSVNAVLPGGDRVVTYPVALSFCKRHGITRRELWCTKCRIPVLLRNVLCVFKYNMHVQGDALRAMLQQRHPVTVNDIPEGVEVVIPK